jgi:poly(3-hydroxybutyrate) depolymerase
LVLKPGKPYNMKVILCCALIAFSTSFGKCHKDIIDESAIKPYTSGKNRFETTVDGEMREYYVHVPRSYKATAAFPVVFMLHGSGGNGEKFYNISGWKEVGEAENIVTVFPSSWKYDCIYDDGIEKPNAEKWNSYDLEFCKGESPRNDIKFLSQVIDEMARRYIVDKKRIYMAGFSNGGEMASRAAIELSHKLAAVVACAGALPVDTTFIPVRKLPVLLQAGNADHKLMAKVGAVDPLPMDIPLLFSNVPAVQEVANTFVTAFALDSFYKTGGDPSKFVYADYTGTPPKKNNVFRFVLVKGLDHNYPNGKNHPMKGAEMHWNWMKHFQAP